MQVGADNQSAFVLSNNIRHVMKAQEEGDMVSCWSQRKCTLKKRRGQQCAHAEGNNKTSMHRRIAFNSDFDAVQKGEKYTSLQIRNAP